MLTPALFVSQCRACLASGGTPNDIAALTKAALAAQAADACAWAGDEVLHRADDLLIVNLTLPPFAASPIHDHGAWAVVGVCGGCEVEHCYERRGGTLHKTGEVALQAGDTLVMEAQTIHAISNPLGTPTRGLHVYGKDLAVTPRRMWHPDTGVELAFDMPTFERWEQALTERARAGATGHGVPPS